MKKTILSVNQVTANMYEVTGTFEGVGYVLTMICASRVSEASKWNRDAYYSNSFAYADTLGNSAVDGYYDYENHPMTKAFVPMIKSMYEGSLPELPRLSDEEYYEMFPEKRPVEEGAVTAV